MFFLHTTPFEPCVYGAHYTCVPRKRNNEKLLCFKKQQLKIAVVDTLTFNV